MKKFKVETPPRDEKYIIEANSEEEANEIARNRENEIAKKYLCLPGDTNVVEVTDWKVRKQALLPSSFTARKDIMAEIKRQIENDLISPEEFKSFLRN